MDLRNFVLVLAAAINTFLGILVLVKNRRSKSNLWFGTFVLSLVAWCITMVLYRAAKTTEDSHFWAVWLYETAIFIPITFVHFASYFPDRERTLGRAPSFLLWLPVAALIYLTYAPKLVITGVVLPTSGEKIITWGKYYVVYNVYFVVYFCLLFFILFKKFHQSEGILRTQIKFILLGTFLPSLFANASNLLLPTFGVFYFNWLGQALTLVMVTFIFYAIIQHQLLNIKVIAIEIFAALIPLVLLVDAFFSASRTETIWKGIVFLLVSFFSFLIIQSVLKEIRSKEQIQAMAKELAQSNAELLSAQARVKEALRLERRAYEKLEKLDKAKVEFLNLASHQLRSPTSVIKGIASMMMEGDFKKLPKAKQKEFIDGLFEKSYKLESTIEDILNASELTGEKFKVNQENVTSVDFRKLIDKIARNFEPKLLQRQIDLKIATPPEDLPAILGEERFLEEAFTNLVDNAIKYTPDDRGDSKSEKGQSGSLQINIRIYRNNNNLIFEISDKGIGIPSKEIPNLFKKFQRASNARNMYADGSGLGLFIAKEIIEGHGGNIAVESEVNKGTKFSVRLPLHGTQPPDIKQYIIDKQPIT